MQITNPTAVALTAGYTESHGAGAGCPEWELWRATLRQAAEDLLDLNECIRQDAVAFFMGDDLFKVMDYAGIDCSCASALRQRAMTICQQPKRSRRRGGITYRGEVHTVEEWAKLTGISVHTLGHRLRHGWSTKRALETPGRH